MRAICAHCEYIEKWLGLISNITNELHYEEIVKLFSIFSDLTFKGAMHVNIGPDPAKLFVDAQNSIHFDELFVEWSLMTIDEYINNSKWANDLSKVNGNNLNEDITSKVCPDESDKNQLRKKFANKGERIKGNESVLNKVDDDKRAEMRGFLKLRDNVENSGQKFKGKINDK